ncbi:MFS transporter [Paenibacillus glufosinatiresistens]|uniref:MFS transporter n=1 Tax=Paenibacillus glufosinatiresistens TaxID=3070657 RepID=UPI00286E69CF|nr:MFS transporter [Paenibacillus sp. YX.27]
MKTAALTKPGYAGLLKSNVPFRHLWTARSISFLGDSLYNLVISWLIYSMTGSALQVGLVLVTKFLPQMLLGLFIGAWVDRRNQQRLMQLADLGQGLLTACLWILMLTGQLRIFHVHLITAALSILAHLFATSQSSRLPELISDRAHFMTANSLMSISQQITRILGTVFGGMLIAVIGNGGAVLINSASFLVSLLFIRMIPYNITTEERRTGGARSMLAEIREGWQWLRSQKVLMLLIALGTATNIALGPSNVLPPMLIKNTFHGGTTELGLFDACIGAGLLLGGLLTGIRSPRRAGLAFVLGLGCQGAASLLIAAAPGFWLACLGNLLLGFGVTFSVIPMSTLFQILIPPPLRGRVNSISSMGFSLSIPVTYGAVGILADHIGTAKCYAIAGALFLLCFLAGLLSTELRRADTGLGRSPQPSSTQRSV